MKPRGGEGQNGRLKCPMGFLVNNVTDGLCFAVVPYLSEINRAKSFAPLSVPHVWDSRTHNKQ